MKLITENLFVKFSNLISSEKVYVIPNIIVMTDETRILCIFILYFKY